MPNDVARNPDCGDCDACCRYLRIDCPEMTKLPGDPCKHHDAKSRCAIYAERPQTCREFVCGWRLLPLAPEWRPDRCQILIVPESGDPATGVPDGCKFLFFGGLDKVFWRPFVDLVSTLVLRNAPSYVSVLGPRGYNAAKAAVHTIPLLRKAVESRNFDATVSILSHAIQSCIDMPKDALTFQHPRTD